jgi:hypothetical protein
VNKLAYVAARLTMPNPTQPALDDPEIRELFIEKWPKVCACGYSISEAEWETLHYIGLQKVPKEYGLPDMELRDCGNCGSTIAVVVPGDFVQ